MFRASGVATKPLSWTSRWTSNWHRDAKLVCAYVVVLLQDLSRRRALSVGFDSRRFFGALCKNVCLSSPLRKKRRGEVAPGIFLSQDVAPAELRIENRVSRSTPMNWHLIRSLFTHLSRRALAPGLLCDPMISYPESLSANASAIYSLTCRLPKMRHLQ